MSGDQLMAVVQYLLPDGSIGGSGRRLPDPKWLRDCDTGALIPSAVKLSESLVAFVQASS
jgi:hypothetical protein